MRIASLLLLLVLLVPFANAQTTEELIWDDPGQEGEQLRGQILEVNHEIVASSISGNFTWQKFHSLDLATNQSTLFFSIDVTYTFQLSSEGTWNYTLEARDGNSTVSMDDCYWHVSTFSPGGFLEGDLIVYPYYHIECAGLVIGADEDDEFTYWINRTVLSGTPDVPLSKHITVKGNRADFVVYPMDINILNLEFWLPVLFWVGFLVAALWWDWQWTAAFAIPGLLQGLFPDQIPGDFSQYLLLAIIGVILEYFRGRKSNKEAVMR